MNTEYSNILYKKYADLCLNKNQYNSLVKYGIIPNGLENIYDGCCGRLSAGVGKQLIKGPYRGRIPEEAASYKELLFFEDWSNCSIKGTCMLIYQDFLVLCSEPKDDVLDHTLKPNLPVVIPLYRIADLSLSETRDSDYNPVYALKITFDNDKTYSAKLFTRVSYSNGYGTKFGPYLQGCNWSFEANQILLNQALKYTSGYEIYNQTCILNKLKMIINNAKNFSKIEDAILNLGCSTIVTNRLLDSMYSNRGLLVFTMVENLNELRKSKCSSDLIDKLESVELTIRELNSQIIKFREKLKEINKELRNKEKELETVSLFKKKSIKDEINKLEMKIEDYSKKIKSSCVPSSKIAEIYDCLLKYLSDNISDFDSSKNKLALKLYEMCNKRGIENLNSEDDEILFEAICKNLNIDSSLNLKKLFEQGKKCYNEKDRPTKKEILLKSIADEELYKSERDKTKFIGKDKYFNKIDLIIQEKNAMKELMDFDYQAGKLATKTKAVKSDEYILGGLANGIAGGAAGLATVNDIRQKNAAAEIYAQKTVSQGYKLMNDSREKKQLLNNDIYELERRKSEIDEKLCDINHREKYFEYLDCRVTDYKVEINGNLTINVEVGFKKEPVIKDIPIVIDGSLLINIKHNNKIVGNAYLNAPGFNVTSIRKIGFNYEQKYSIIGLSMDGEFDENIDYEFEIKPINIWMIEK